MEMFNLKLKAQKEEVTKLMQKDVVQEETPDRELRPLGASPGTESGRRLFLDKKPGQAHSWWKCAHRDFPTASAHISENAGAAAPIIEVHVTQPSIGAVRKATEDHPHVFLAYMVDAITVKSDRGELYLSGHCLPYANSHYTVPDKPDYLDDPVSLSFGSHRHSAGGKGKREDAARLPRHTC